MLTALLDYNADLLLAAIVLAMAGAHAVRRLRRNGQALHFGTRSWTLLAVIVAVGAVGSVWLGHREAKRIRENLLTLLPTYADELRRAGHERVTLSTAADDPTYLRLIDMQKRWLALNPNIADVYTMVVTDKQTVRLLVDSETDYDRDGTFTGDTESRTAIGEPLELEGDGLESVQAALHGSTQFIDEPSTDRWGTWVSAHAPVPSDDGSVHAILGVDYLADAWSSSILLHRGIGLSITMIAALAALGHAYRRAMLQAEVKRRQHTEEALRESERQLAAARKLDLVRMHELATTVDHRTQELQHQATHDRLTGLPNRELLFARLRQALAETTANQRPFAVLFIDLDRFKLINDSLGHHAGDRVLVQVADRLRETLRDVDPRGESTVARLGGDEFCVLIPGIGLHTAITTAEQLLAELEISCSLDHRDLHCAGSIGVVAVTDGRRYAAAEDVVRDADIAMYHAKRAGRQRYAVFDDAMHTQVHKRLEVENDLRRAVERGQISVVYQPIVDVRNSRVVSCEALARWTHPVHGPIPPDRFITMAEEIGFIGQIGEFVMARACEQLAAWSHDPDKASITISVNLSPKQFSESLPGLLRHMLSKYGVHPSRLILEITETSLTADVDQARRLLQELRGMGLPIFLDDFGTGYSALSSLSSFPLTGLKLDRGFMRDVGVGAVAASSGAIVGTTSTPRERIALLDAMISLAKHLKLTTVAEGVESMEQLALLTTLDCDRVQGFIFSRAVNAEMIQTPATTMLPIRSAAA